MQLPNFCPGSCDVQVISNTLATVPRVLSLGKATYEAEISGVGKGAGQFLIGMSRGDGVEMGTKEPVRGH